MAPGKVVVVFGDLQDAWEVLVASVADELRDGKSLSMRSLLFHIQEHHPTVGMSWDSQELGGPVLSLSPLSRYPDCRVFSGSYLY